MSKVIRLTESDIEKVVSGVIKQKNTQELKSTNTLMVEINSMLNFHYKSNSAFLKYTEDFSERFNILQDVKNTGKNLAKNTKNWKKAGIQGNSQWMGNHYKDAVSNTKKLVKTTVKAGQLGNKVATEV
jgi:hemerythrin